MRKTAMLVVVVMLSGCGKSNVMHYHIGRQSGNATLSLGGTTLIFEGIPDQGADVPTKATGFFMISGSGTTNGNSSVDAVTLKYDYANGVTNLTFNDYGFKLTENGTKLVFGEQTFPLGTKTIRVAKDGSAKITE